jgi:uncharacterized membrane protein YbaN (DUF454 family)
MSAALKRYLFFVLGTLSLAIGIVGIFTPVLPTTPFLLLPAACYLRSSKRFHHWLMHNRVFSSYIRNYTEGRGIAVRVKLFIIALLWATIGVSIWAVDNLMVTIVLVIVAVGISLHIALIRARKDRPTA